MSRPLAKKPAPKSVASQQQAAKRSPKTGWMIMAGVAVLVLIAAVIAFSSGDDPVAPAAGVEQIRPVTVAGQALVTLPDPPAADPAVGTKAPTVDGQTFAGESIKLAPGKAALYVFVAHWCPHCQREVPLLTKWKADGGVPEGVDVVAIATSTTDTRPNYPPSAWLEREKFPFKVLADDATFDAAAAFGVSGFPFFVLVDADGIVRMRTSGEVEMADLATMITSALSAK